MSEHALTPQQHYSEGVSALHKAAEWHDRVHDGRQALNANEWAVTQRGVANVIAIAQAHFQAAGALSSIEALELTRWARDQYERGTR